MLVRKLLALLEGHLWDDDGACEQHCKLRARLERAHGAGGGVRRTARRRSRSGLLPMSQGQGWSQAQGQGYGG